MKRLSFLTALALMPWGALFAQDEAEKSAAPFALEFTGLHEFDYGLPLDGDSWNYDGEMLTPRFRNELGVDVKEGDIHVVSRWQFDTTTDPGLIGQDQWSGATRARDLESYVAWNPDKFKLGFGYQIYAWGVADGRNPTDNLNPRDYTTLVGEKPLKIPVLSADVNWYPTEQVSVEAVFVPQAQTSLFPISTQAELEGFFPAAAVSYQPLANDPSQFVAGGKLNYRSQAVDLSVSYLYDFDSLFTPDITLDNSGNVTSIALVRNRVQRFGADAKTTIDRFGVWAEGAYSLTGNQDTSSYSQRLSRIDYTVGFDFNYGPQDDYYLNLQYTGSVIPGYNDSANTDTSDPQRYYERMLVGFVGSEEEAVTQGITWNASWNLASGTVVPKLTGAYSLPFFYDNSQETRYGNLLLEPSLDFMPIDSFHIRIGMILAYAWVKKAGDSNVSLDTTVDPVGIYTPSNNLFVSVSYQWNDITNKQP
jgi:hypothetical protein